MESTHGDGQSIKNYGANSYFKKHEGQYRNGVSVIILNKLNHENSVQHILLVSRC
jgi:hypothetical protein